MTWTNKQKCEFMQKHYKVENWIKISCWSRLVNYLVKSRELCFTNILKDVVYRTLHIPTRIGNCKLHNDNDEIDLSPIIWEQSIFACEVHSLRATFLKAINKSLSFSWTILLKVLYKEAEISKVLFISKQGSPKNCKTVTKELHKKI